ncbi:hypothetical protein J2747_001347 [Thermococcus stetteri]|nr:hypothetical protein [Thermococcus stetteri]
MRKASVLIVLAFMLLLIAPAVHSASVPALRGHEPEL